MLKIQNIAVTSRMGRVSRNMNHMEEEYVELLPDLWKVSKDTIHPGIHSLTP